MTVGGTFFRDKAQNHLPLQSYGFRGGQIFCPDNRRFLKVEFLFSAALECFNHVPGDIVHILCPFPIVRFIHCSENLVKLFSCLLQRGYGRNASVDFLCYCGVKIVPLQHHALGFQHIRSHIVFLFPAGLRQ